MPQRAVDLYEQVELEWSILAEAGLLNTEVLRALNEDMDGVWPLLSEAERRAMCEVSACVQEIVYRP
jgi:hypothetical protein